MPLEDGPHLEELRAALAAEATGQRALLGGDETAARAALHEAAARYRASWELAGPESFGRLIGMLKAAVLAGDGAAEAAAYAREQLPEPPASPAAAYASAIAALVEGDDGRAAAAAATMRSGSPAFGRAADAIAALAERDDAGYTRALAAIVADFEGREEHLTGVPIADTALMLERLAQPRGLAAGPSSPLLPPTGSDPAASGG